MLTLGVRYLNGWSMATHPADRKAAEWPPHPERVFFALAAAHFETGADPSEAEALVWLETLEPPRLVLAQAHERDAVTSFVPVNDDPSPVSKGKPVMAVGSLEIGRVRQPRQFPVAVPEDPTIYLVWTDARPPDDHRSAIERLCGKVTRVGHSASLVQMWADDDAPEPSPRQRWLVPVAAGRARYHLRVPAAGRLAELSDLYPALHPSPRGWQGYEVREERPAEQEPPTSCFASDLLVLRRVAGPALALPSTLQVTGYLHRAILALSPDPVPEWLSGHRADRRKSEQDHVAFLPLAHVGRPHADGHLLGLGLALPRGLPVEARASALGDLLFDDLGRSREIELKMGRLGVWTLALEERDYRLLALRPEVWTAGPPRAGAASWGTVTPISLDRHPKGADFFVEMEASVVRGCGRIGLPEPREVVLSPTSVFAGAPSGREMPLLRRKGDAGRVRHTHAVIHFDEPVVGPVLVGAGRYRGYGLCRPIPEDEEAP